MKTKPRVSKGARENRNTYALEHHTWTHQWNHIIFSDEKKFNFEGPDGFAYYWHDLRKEKKLFSTRQSGGGSVMAWVGFSSERKCELFLTTKTINSRTYTNILDACMLPVYHQMELDMDEECMFMQDNAAVHTSHHSMAWLESKGVALLHAPTSSPDLNPVENAFGNLARRVYSGNKQFNSTVDLEAALRRCWEETPLAELSALIASMPDRMGEVIAKIGKPTSY